MSVVSELLYCKWKEDGGYNKLRCLSFHEERCLNFYQKGWMVWNKRVNLIGCAFLAGAMLIGISV